MKLIETSVKRPVGVIICVLIAMLIGAVSLNGLAVDLLPNMELPVAVVVTSYQGAAPEEVVNLVTKPLEGVLSTLEGLDTIQSTSVTNQSMIILMFNYGSNMDSTLLDIRDKVDMGKQMLPDDASDPMVIKFDPSMMPVMQLSLSGDLSIQELTKIAEDTVQTDLERVAGVAQVSVTGKQDREIRIEPDPAKLEGYRLSIQDISNALAMNNMNMSAGNIIRGSNDVNVRLIGEYQNIQDIRDVTVPTATGQKIKLSELATVTDTYKEQSTYAYINGSPALSLSISKQSDANTVSVAESILKQIDRIKADLPNGVELTVVLNSAEFIQLSISNVLNSLLLGSLFAAIVLFLFLRNFRSTLVMLLSIPISLVVTFIMIYFYGETLNIITMSGLALGVGMLLDGAIVILENIYRYRQKGYGNVEAAVEGAKEVVMPVIASALTTVAVFVPIIFTEGMVAELFRPLALTISFSLLASLVVSVTLIPMLSTHLIRAKDIGGKEKSEQAKSGFINKIGAAVGNIYPSILKWALGHKKTVIILTSVLIVGSLILIPYVKIEFMPAMDQGEINISLTMPNGTSAEETYKVAAAIEEYMMQMPDTEMISTTIGGGDMMGGTSSSNAGTIYARLVPLKDRVKSTNDSIKDIEAFGMQFPDLKLNIVSMQSAGYTGAAISVQITGNDVNVLKALGEEVEQQLIKVPGLTNIANSLSATRPELHVKMKSDIIAEYGLSGGQIMQMVRAGFYGQTASIMKQEGSEIDLYVTLPKEYRESLDHLQSMKIMTHSGFTVPLKELADFALVEGPNTITRENMEQGITLSADLLDADLQTAYTQVSQLVNQLHMPAGYGISLGGQNEELVEAMVSLVLALVLGIFLVYGVMAVQFESALYPFIIMFSLPATVVGIIFGLLITGQTLSVFGMIGVVMLAGIVVSNAIVMVDYINTLRSRGMEREEAVFEAAKHRLRPILMTTLTTVLAMVPISIGMGEGTEMQQSLGTVIVFGLSFSTLITLVLIPVVYIYMDRFSKWLGSKFVSSNVSSNVNSNVSGK